MGLPHRRHSCSAVSAYASRSAYHANAWTGTMPAAVCWPGDAVVCTLVSFLMGRVGGVRPGGPHPVCQRADAAGVAGARADGRAARPFAVLTRSGGNDVRAA